MAQLNRTTAPMPQYPEKVIQFGGGNFLRAFFDWQVQQMNEKGLFQGSAVVVQPIPTGLETTLMPEQDYCYTVLFQGVMNGETVDRSEVVTTVSRAINPYDDHAAYLALAEQESLEFIVSNTTEAGIAYNPADKLDDAPQQSFPGKLTALLHRRWKRGGKGFTIIPCELIDNNGAKLKECVLRYAEDWALGEAFKAWLLGENTFCNSLVDRIVPGYPRGREEELWGRFGYEDKLMVVCEPYMIWVIQGPKELEERLPLAKAGLNVIVTDDMPLYRERKVHILNGPHTAMALLGTLAGLETVGQVMEDEDFGPFVIRMTEREIIPALSQPADQLTAYAAAIQERFRNPFLVHRLDSILLNSVSKYAARLLPMVGWFLEKQGRLPDCITAALAGLLVLYRGDKAAPQDDGAVVAKFADAWQNPATLVEAILGDESLWGRSLLSVEGLAGKVRGYVDVLVDKGARALVKTLNSRE